LAQGNLIDETAMAGLAMNAAFENVPYSLVKYLNMKSIHVGDQAPEIAFRVHDGRAISLADFKGRQIVVLFFYPADDTPICTQEACSFRDAYEQFLQSGATVIGVSSDSESTHQLFAQSQRLPYLLASDVDGSLRRAFGVPKTLGLLAGRVTYVIDRDGIVRDVFQYQFSGKKHVGHALHIVRMFASQQHRDP
jgi:peroxiredoxin Q/BCP